MIAERSDLVAGLADPLLASALTAGVNISVVTASAAVKDERHVEPRARDLSGRA